MPLFDGSGSSSGSGGIALPWIVRHVQVVRGRIKWQLECFPAFDYARMAHTTEIVSNVAQTPSVMDDEWNPGMSGNYHCDSVRFSSADG